MTTDRGHHTGTNRLLAALEPRDHQQLAPHLDRVRLARGDVLFEQGEELRHAWFPESCIVSLIILMRDGGSSEAATTGREGMVGLMAALSNRRALSRAVVQMPGHALQLPAGTLRTAFEANPRVRQRFLCYVNALLAQVLQSSACNALHPVEARLCRWLLQMEDRTEGGPSLPLTHDFLAEMLGTHRTTVTLAARALQRAGLIDYGRGQVTLLDRPGLEQVARECYATIREHERLLFRNSG
jgi:CRP-like cAMP-binding protein